MLCTIFTHPTNNSGCSKSKLQFISQHFSLTFASNQNRRNLYIRETQKVAAPVLLQADPLRTILQQSQVQIPDFHQLCDPWQLQQRAVQVMA